MLSSVVLRSLTPLLLITGLATAADEGAAAIAASLPAVTTPGPTINGADTAWMLVATALVLFMTIPGLALFYGGLVRAKNVLTVLAKCFAITCLVSILWVAFGYSLAFDQTGMQAGIVNLHSFIGTFAKAGLLGVGMDSTHPAAPTIPETVFCLFQMTFAIITPALLVGAFAERIKFSVVMWFSALWLVIVYLPICHMAWAGPGSFFGDHLGVLDFAGGTVVEVNSGIAGLVAALVVGRRIGYLHEPILPHNMPFCVMGAGMLWVGWLGFNGGSALSANGTAGMAALTTHLAGAAAGFVYMICEWKHLGKPSMLGIVTGAVAGLVAITPACGYVGPLGGMAVGGAAALASFIAITQIKARFRYDDSLDVFGVHGVGGMVGLVLTGVFCAPMLGGAHANTDIPHQVWMQTLAMLITIGWSAVGTAALLYVLDRVVGLRPSTTDELSGLDLPLHGEAAYNH